MANGTSDKCAAGVQPKTLHAGACVVRARYTASASHSPTDVIQMVKVPHGAIIDEVQIHAPSGVASAPAALTISVGDGGDPNRYFSGSYSTTAVIRATSGLGYEYSLSDDAVVQYDTIDITIDAGALTASQAVEMIVTYHLDEGSKGVAG